MAFSFDNGRNDFARIVRRRETRKTVMTVAVALLSLFILFAASGCTTRTSLGENTDYEQQEAEGSAGTEASRSDMEGTGSEEDRDGDGGRDAQNETEAASEEDAWTNDGLHRKTPRYVRGIYLTGWSAGIPERLEDRLAYIKRNNLNTLVIDIKDDDGRLSFDLPGTRASAIGANNNKIADPEQLLARLHEEGIYVIGRLVTFADPYASQKHPEWSIIQNGRLWRDYRNISWLSPWSREAWDYNIEIGVAAAKLGFDEIQFDYVRLPESKLPGYNDTADEQDRVEQVTRFLAEARETIQREAGVPVSADVFGISSVTKHDAFIGQSYPDIARVVDYISPMNYPSLYAKGELGIADPYKRPYDIVLLTVLSAIERTADLPLEVQRPWLQAYSYGPDGITAQLEAIAGAGLRSFMLWNAQNVYPDGVNFAVVDERPLIAPNAYWTQALYRLARVKVPVALPEAVQSLPEGLGHSVRVTAGERQYSVEMWATQTQLAANDPIIEMGEPLLVVQGAHLGESLPELPSVIRGEQEVEETSATGAGSSTVGEDSAHRVEVGQNGSGTSAAIQTNTERHMLFGGIEATLTSVGNGVALEWQTGEARYRLWGSDPEAALRAAESMKHVTILEGR